MRLPLATTLIAVLATQASLANPPSLPGSTPIPGGIPGPGGSVPDTVTRRPLCTDLAIVGWNGHVRATLPPGVTRTAHPPVSLQLNYAPSSAGWSPPLDCNTTNNRLSVTLR